jgi:hypothetical protein
VAVSLMKIERGTCQVKREHISSCLIVSGVKVTVSYYCRLFEPTLLLLLKYISINYPNFQFV